MVTKDNRKAVPLVCCSFWTVDTIYIIDSESKITDDIFILIKISDFQLKILIIRKLQSHLLIVKKNRQKLSNCQCNISQQNHKAD